MAPHISQPPRQLLLLPVLDALSENGPMRPRDVAAVVAEKLDLPKEVVQQTVVYGGDRSTKVFERSIRWTRQTAVADGLIADGRRGLWALADRGEKMLSMAKPGFAVVVARSESGAVIWGEALSAVGLVEDESLSLVLQSPPYPLRRQRDYGGWSTDGYVQTLTQHCCAIGDKLARTGSLVINLADVYAENSPTLLPYQEEFVLEMIRKGFYFAGRQAWFNPSKPKTTPYVTKERSRLANGLETFFWFSPSERPKADNRHVLNPYSESFQRKLAAGGELRRGGSAARQSSPGMRYRVDHGGSIPFNLVQTPHEGSNSAYIRHCKSSSLPVHPARMPQSLAEFWIRFTTDPGEIVGDFFGGSLTTAAACQKLGRSFVAGERCLDYIQGGMFRLDGSGRLSFDPAFDCSPTAASA